MNQRLLTILRGLKMSLFTWVVLIIIGMMIVSGIRECGQSKPSAAAITYTPETRAAAPTPIDPILAMRQRVAADKPASELLKKLGDGSPEFCWRDLPKIRNSKLSFTESEAYMIVASLYGTKPIERINIYEKNVSIGMSECAAIASWGRPMRNNTSTGRGYERQQWVYPGGNYLYIERGIVASMQTSK